MKLQVSMPIRASLHFHNGSKKIAIPTFCVSMPIRTSLHFHFLWQKGQGGNNEVSMPIRASLHFHSTLLEAAETKHFPDLFCRYLSENSENRNFQNHFCPVHNLFIFYSVAGTIRSYSCNTIFF